MARRPLVLSTLLLLTACSPASHPPPNGPASPAAQDWVEATLRSLTLRQKVAQMVSPWVGGEYLAADSEGFARLREWVVDQEIGGVIISIGPPLEIADKLNRLQRLARVPLLVSADMEFGPGQRLQAGVVPTWGLELGGGTSFPPLMGIGATADERLAYALGRVTAIEGRAAGIHMTYAPVMDVNNNPANPIINTRSYGEDPAQVGRMAAAHVRGIQEHGMLATAKHFPGHGDTGVDSHIELPVITVGRARVEAVELVPFRAAIEAGVAAFMSAHIAFPELTGDSALPATLSPAILTGVLRQDLGFDGLIVTDALDMGAIVRRYGRGEAAVMAVKAGADQLLMPPDVREAIDAVVAAVERGEITEARIDQSARKLLAIKANLGLHRQRTVSLEGLPEIVGRREHQALAQEAADRSITLVRAAAGVLPLSAARHPRVLSIIYADDFDPFAGRTFNRELQAALPALRTAFVDARAGEAELARLAASADSADIVLFSPFVRVQAWKGDVAVAAPVAAFVNRLAARRPLVFTSFGNPYLLNQFPDVTTYMLGWGHQDVLQRAAARALTGRNGISGTLPIGLPPHHPMGTGVRVAPAAAGGAR
jgi:beta-N-acetylhexosaminidase